MNSIEGFNEDDARNVSVASMAAVELCIETGIHPATAMGPGDQAAVYSAKIIFTAMREMGLISDDAGIDPIEFAQIVDDIKSRSTEPESRAYLFSGKKATHSD